MALTVFATISSILIIPPLLVEIATDLDISVAVAGQLATATFAALGGYRSIGRPLVRPHLAVAPVAIVCLAALSVSMLACAIAPQPGDVDHAAGPDRAGWRSDTSQHRGVRWPTSSPPARRARAVGALLGIQGIAAAISVPLVAVLADVGGWRLPFIVLRRGCSWPGWWQTGCGLPKERGERVRNFAYLSRYRSLVSMRFFRVAVAVNLTQRIAFWGTISYFAAYLINTFDLSVGFVALPLAIAALGQTVGNYAASFAGEPEVSRAPSSPPATAPAGAFGFGALFRGPRTVAQRWPWRRSVRDC